MDTPRNTADKVRPIIQAMERSIDSARSRRMQGGNVPGRESTSAALGTNGTPESSTTPAAPGTFGAVGTPGVPPARPMMPPLANSTPNLSGLSPANTPDTSISTNGAGDSTDPNQPPRLKARAKARPKLPNGTINGSPTSYQP